MQMQAQTQERPRRRLPVLRPLDDLELVRAIDALDGVLEALRAYDAVMPGRDVVPMLGGDADARLLLRLPDVTVTDSPDGGAMVYLRRHGVEVSAELSPASARELARHA